MNDDIQREQDEVMRRAASIEDRCLAWAWLPLALAGAAGAALVAGGFWAFVARDASLARFDAPGFLALAAAAGLLAGCGAALVWRLGRAAERAMPALRRFPIAPVVAVVLVLGADAVARSVRFQNPLWLAVRSRTGITGTDYFAGELAYLKLESLAPPTGDRPAAIFAGSSQLLRGIDYDQMASLLDGAEVRRRCLAGMDPLKALAARDLFGVRRGDLLVLYVSEFDVGSNPDLNLDWLRPVMTTRADAEVRAALEPVSLLSRWRALTDLSLAARVEVWRSRDYLSLVVERLAGPPSPPPQTPPGATSGFDAQREAYSHVRVGQPFNEVHFRALERLIREARAEGADVLVFEGRINPAMRTPRGDALREAVRDRVSKMASELGFVYVPEPEQTFVPGEGDWADGTHLNARGREAFTRYAAGVIARVMEGAR